MPRIDYDRIATVYDERWRDHPVDPWLIAFLEERRSARQRPARVLDLGCGTGKQLTANRESFPTLRLVGVDRSMAMLRVAQQRCRAIAWVHGDATSLPIASSSVDYACCQFAHAHIADKRALLREAFRVLAAGGRFVLTNIDPWAMSGWMLYRFFPAALERDHADFTPAETLLEWMRAAGFANPRFERLVQEYQMPLREFLAYASSRHRASQLTAIADEDYAAGLRALQRRVDTEPDVVEPWVFCLVTFVGDR